MKKTFFYSLALSIFGIGILTFSASAAAEVETTNLLIQPRATMSADGELIKGESYETVYYLAEDGKRYVFPNSKTYFSWYDDFTTVREVTDEELFGYPLGGNVRYRPGSLLVKITTNPKVYAVGENGKLRWVKSEKAAKALYGDNWNKLIDDIADSFFTNYEIGDDVEGIDDFDPAEMEEEYPSISHNRGFRAREIAQNRAQNRVERRCEVLENAVNKLQKRIGRYGIKVDGLGDDFASECVEGGLRHLDKVEVCHLSANGEYKTLEVSPNALRGMFSNRATLGACDETLLEAGDDEEALECADDETMEEIDGVDTCVTVVEEDEELSCEDNEEIVTDENGEESCQLVEEEVEGLECAEGEVIEDIDGVDTCIAEENEDEEELECAEGEEAGTNDEGEDVCVPVTA